MNREGNRDFFAISKMTSPGAILTSQACPEPKITYILTPGLRNYDPYFRLRVRSQEIVHATHVVHVGGSRRRQNCRADVRKVSQHMGQARKTWRFTWSERELLKCTRSV